MTMHRIASQVLTNDTSSWIQFNSIPQTFTHLQLRVFGRTTVASAYENMYIRPNGNTQIIYNGSTLFGDGTSAGSGNYLNYDSMEFGPIVGANISPNNYGVIIIDFLDYANTSKFKTARALGGHDNNGAGIVIMKTGLWRSTDAISQFIITYPPLRAGTRFDLYGITSNQIATGA